MTIRERDLDLMRTMYYQPGFRGDNWNRPMDLGASDSSWHSGALRKLVKYGLVERRTRGSDRSYCYRLTDAGARHVARHDGHI